jgi:CPA1 family monovalent cation:H+ antiporter
MRWFRGTFAAANLPHFFLDGAVALLVFAGSLHVDIKELSRRRWLILLLATASVILSTAIFGTGMWLAFAAIVGESLFNDGAGVVLFLLALGVTQGDTLVLGHGHVLAALLREIVGGAGLGLVAGWGPRCLCAAFTTKACSC